MTTTKHNTPTTKTTRSLHVVLEHRSDAEWERYLDFLRSLSATTSPSRVVTKLSIFADMQWVQQGHIISVEQRQRLLETLGDFVCPTVESLQIDLLCDLYGDYDMSMSTSSSNNNNNNNSRVIHFTADNDNDVPVNETTTATNTAQERLQVLPCSLVTYLVQRAPHLQSLALKELFLSGTDPELHEFVACLQRHPTLHTLDVRWKLAGSTTHHSRVLTPFIAGIAAMPQLTSLCLMIPYASPSLEQLPLATSLTTVKVTIEKAAPPQLLTRLLHHWKQASRVQWLELSALNILQDATTQSALLDFVRDNSSVEHLVVIDHNIFESHHQGHDLLQQQQQQQQQQQPHQRSTAQKCVSKDQSQSSSFADLLVDALQHNTVLRHLQWISRNTMAQRRRSSSSSTSSSMSSSSSTSSSSSFVTKMDRVKARHTLGLLMQHNYELEHLEISHQGLQIAAPAPMSVQDSLYPYHCVHGIPCTSKTTSKPTTATTSSSSSRSCGGDLLDFYLRLNQDGYRRQLLLVELPETQQQQHMMRKDKDKLWHEAILHYQNDTPALFDLLQASPSVIRNLL